MKCNKCGEELKVNAKFCPNCGTAVSIQKDSIQEESVQNGIVPEKKKKSPIAYILIAAAAICIIGGIIFFKTRPEVIDLQEYVTCDINGYDGYGTAYLDIKEDKLVNDVYTIASEKKELTYVTPEDFVTGLGINFKISKDSRLSNGDKVKIKFIFDNKKVKEYGIKFKGETKEIKVEKLKKVKKVDIFKKLKLKFSGDAPEAYTDEDVTLKAGGESFYCLISPNENLSIGDKITVECTDKEPINGVAPKSYKTTVTVPDTMNHYIEDPTELTTDDLANIKGKVERRMQGDDFSNIRVYMTTPDEDDTNEYLSYYDISNVTIGNEFKFYADIVDDDGVDVYNRIEVPVEMDISNRDEYSNNYGEVIHCYGYCSLSDMLRKKNGKLKLGDAGLYEFFNSAEDRDEALNDENELEEIKTKYTVTFDGSKQPEKMKEE